MSNTLNKVVYIPLKINWHEGMLLSQHHFQQNDHRIFQEFSTQLHFISPYHFGVQHIQYDKTVLSNGIYRIAELEAVFPDGLLFRYFPGIYKDLKPLEIDISSKNENIITIYLVIAELSNTISPITGNPARYYTIDSESPTKDDNLNENEISIPKLFPNAFLHIGKVLPEFCIGFPICKLSQSEGTYNIVDWTPPCFYITRDSSLWKKCIELIQSLREKVTFLVDKFKDSTSESVSFDTYRILSNLEIFLPSFEVLVYSNNIKPYELYQELARLLGIVSVLIPTDIVPVMSPYDHTNIDECVYPVIKLIEHYLSIVDRGYIILPFNKKERFFYKYITKQIFESIHDNKLYVGIRGNALTSLSDIDNWMKNAVIASDFALDKVRAKRIQGAIRQVLKQEIVARILPSLGIMLFEIEVDSKYIKEEQNLHIFNPGNISKFQPQEVILYLPRSVKE